MKRFVANLMGIVALFAPALCWAQGYTITTVAGGGSPTSDDGDGGPATSAILSEPWGVAVDASGNVYIAERGRHVIREVASNGIIFTVAGASPGGYAGDGGPATRAQLSSPYGVAVDSAGNLYYIADYGNGRIRKVSTNGIIRGSFRKWNLKHAKRPRATAGT